MIQINEHHSRPIPGTAAHDLRREQMELSGAMFGLPK